MPANRGDPTRQRFPGFNGKLLFDTYRGRVRVRAWPRKRGPGGTKRQLLWRAWFKEANALAKRAAPQQMYLAMKMARGTGKYPRDILIQAMSTGFFDIRDENGDTIKHRWPFLEPIMFQGAALENKTEQTIPGGVLTTISWSLPEIDTAQIWNVSTPTRLTVPEGVEIVSLTHGMDLRDNHGGTKALYIRKNGSSVVAKQETTGANTGDGTISTPPLNVVAGDYFEALVFASQANVYDDVPASSFSMTLLQIAQ